jgi:thiol-disulfide isomerase/thioredoxin
MLLRAALLLSLSSQVFGIDNLKLNSKLDYSSDSLDGPLITGDDAQSGFVSGKTNYVIIYGEGCFNSKRQARRTVELYNKYRDQVHFVVVDLDEKRSPDQQKLVKQYYEGSIPHVLILDASGKPLYNSAGEVDSKHISSIFEQSFSQASGRSK